MDKEFAEAFKEEIELDEMKWAVGGVYHQEFKNGDRVYFRADSVQKNKRWKGMSVDEFGGRQKKPKNVSADEKQQGWVTTPKNEIPKGLKEDVDLIEGTALQVKMALDDVGLKGKWKNNKVYVKKRDVEKAEKALKGNVIYKGKPPVVVGEEVEIEEGKFKKGDIVIPNIGPHKGEKHTIIHDFKNGSYNISLNKKHSRYDQGAAKAKENQLKLVKEEVELDEFYTVFAVRHKEKDGKRYVIPFKTKQKADKKAKELKSAGATEIEVTKEILKGNIKWKEEVEIEEARKAAKDIGLECQECGKRFRSANPRYGVTKCPKCKSTDLDLAYGEEVEIDEVKNNWAVIDTAPSGVDRKKNEIMALATDEKDAYSSIKYSEGPRGYQSGSGKSKKTLKVVRIKKKYDIGDVFKEEVNEARSKEDELEVAKAIAAWKKAGGKIKKLPPGRKFQSLFGKGYKPKKQPRQAEEVETEASTYRDKKYGKKKTGKVPPSQKEIRWGRGGYGKEEVEVDEADVMRYRRGKAEKSVDDKFKKKAKAHTGYELYHKDFSSAMQHAYAHAKKKGVVVDPKEIDDKVATGPKKPSSGKTNRYALKAGRKTVHIQVANLDNKRYELNMYIESNVTLGEIKKVLSEAPSPNQAAIDAFLKKGGVIKKHTPDDSAFLKKRKKDLASFRKSFAKTIQKQKDADKKATRRYVSGGGKQDGSMPYNLPNYVTHKDIKKFPSSLTSGLKKIISGAKMQKYEIKTRKYGKIPGLGITFPGSTVPKLMVQFDEDTSVRDPNPQWSEKGKDPKTFRKFQMTVWINEAATAIDSAIKGKVDWYQRKEFEGSTADEVAKKTLQYLKTKVKRMAKEEVEIDEALKPKDKKVVDDFYDEKKDDQPKATLSTDGKTLWIAGSKAAEWRKGKIEILHAPTGRYDQSVFKYMRKSIPKLNFAKEEVEEVLDIANTKMADVIKDFQNSDAPQFKGKSDKKRREMAIAAKLSADRNESVKEDETDDPKSKKKDKINLKPKMDEKMKKYKDLLQGLKERKSVKEDSDKDTPGTQGDNAEWQKKRSEVLKKFGVGSCAALKDEKEKKACYKALDDAHVADHEEQVKKEVKEAVTTGGIEYGEQDWDIQHRLDQAAPYMDSNFAEFYEQGLEGPYIWHGETYFFDRKVGGWYSVTAEDYVDDEISKDLSLAYVKDGMYKRQFAS